MEILKLPCQPYEKATVTALGFFDGVHIAHTALLKKTVAFAKEKKLIPAVFTFTDAPHKTGERLLSLEERLSRFALHGIEVVFTADFGALKELSPEDFIESILKNICHASAAVCGFNFRFGKNAVGDAAFLQEHLPESIVLDPVKQGGEAVSATRVRNLLEQGAVEDAARLLGKPYTVKAVVDRGKALGRTIGFPTANMKPNELLPKNGVYETRVLIDGMIYAALTDIGFRPTAEKKGERRMETHIPHFSGDLYGKELAVSFIRRLRDEKQFESIEALRAQLALDLAQTERKKIK